jgi:hypothetical protein
MADAPLHVGDRLSGIALEPRSVEVLRDDAELDDQVSGQVLGLKFTALFLPQPKQGGFIRAHDDPGVGAANEFSAIRCIGCENLQIHVCLQV